MRWKTITPAPVEGEVRKKRCFAWLPTRLDDGQTVWLESYGYDARYEGWYEGENWRALRTYTLDYYC
jgi:hypothetical protein